MTPPMKPAAAAPGSPGWALALETTSDVATKAVNAKSIGFIEMTLRRSHLARRWQIGRLARKRRASLRSNCATLATNDVINAAIARSIKISV